MIVFKGNTLRRIANLFSPYRGLSKEIYILALGRVINCAGAFIFPLLTLILTKKVGMSKSDAGLLISLSGVAFALSSIIGGKLTDHLGRKNIIIIFNTLGASSYIIASLMDPSTKMVLFIILAGTLMGMADPAYGALIADITTPLNRDGAYSLFYMCANIGFAVSPIIGGLLFEKHLNVLFIADGATTFIALLLTYLFIPETKDRVNEDFGHDRKMEAKFEGSTISVLKERPILILFALVMLGYNFVYSQWSFMYPLHAEQIIPNNGAKFYGALVSFNAITVLVLTPLITKMLNKKGSLRRIIYGGILYTVGFGLPGFIFKIPSLFFSTFVLTLGEIVVTISSMPFIVNHTPASHRGRINAMLPLVMGAGYSVGPLIMGNVLNVMSISSGWKIVGLIMVIFTIFAVFLEKYDAKNQLPVIDCKTLGTVHKNGETKG